MLFARSLVFFFWSLGCLSFGQDLFEPSKEELRFTIEKAGQSRIVEIDAERSRPARELSREELLEIGVPESEIKEGYIWVANYRHKKKHYIARIPDTAKAFELQIVDRTPNIRPSGDSSDEATSVARRLTGGAQRALSNTARAMMNPQRAVRDGQRAYRRFSRDFASTAPHFHGQIHMLFSEPVALFSQEKAETRAEPITHATDLVLSAEAARPAAEFDAGKAMDDRYRFAYVFASYEEKAAEAKLRRAIHRHRLDIDPNLSENFLRREIRRSQEETYQSAYHPQKKSCLSVLLASIDELFGRETPKRRFFWPHSQEFFLRELRPKGVISQNSYLGTVNEEHNYRITQQAVPQRTQRIIKLIDCAHFVATWVK